MIIAVFLGESSHKQLLIEMTKSFPKRKVTLSEELYNKLMEYMTYRHMFRHAYSFELKWYKMKHLVDDMYNVWNELKEFINAVNVDGEKKA